MARLGEDYLNAVGWDEDDTNLEAIYYRARAFLEKHGIAQAGGEEMIELMGLAQKQAAHQAIWHCRRELGKLA